MLFLNKISFNNKKEIYKATCYECTYKNLDLLLVLSGIDKVNIGLVASGDIFVTDDMMGAKINKKFKALCVEMEGAAIAQVCFLSNVPFLAIKCISDTVLKEDNNLTYNEFLDKSSENIAKYLIKILNILN